MRAVEGGRNPSVPFKHIKRTHEDPELELHDRKPQACIFEGTLLRNKQASKDTSQQATTNKAKQGKARDRQDKPSQRASMRTLRRGAYQQTVSKDTGQTRLPTAGSP